MKNGIELILTLGPAMEIITDSSDKNGTADDISYRNRYQVG